MAVYGTEKLNDAGKAEPILQNMIKLEPGDPANYFMLARLYDDAGVSRGSGADVHRGQGCQAERSGRLHEPRGALQPAGPVRQDNRRARGARREGTGQPRGYQTIASYYWDKANKDSRLKDNEKKDYVLKGIAAVDRALQIKPDYAEGMVYKGLLLRLQANLEKDAAKQQALIKEAVVVAR